MPNAEIGDSSNKIAVIPAPAGTQYGASKSLGSRLRGNDRIAGNDVLFAKPRVGSFAEESAMLVLSRQRDESIIIGDNVVITIVDVRGDKVKLGIEAPKEIPVHRREVYEAILRENRQATLLKPDDTQLLGSQGSPGERV